MIQQLFAAEEAVSGSPLAALGVDGKSFLFQIITFAFVFLLLKKFAFTPITKMLIERRRVIDEGVRAGLKMEKERLKFEQELAGSMREARHEADKIISGGHKEARELIREAEKTAQRKSEVMLVDAEERIAEETAHSKRKLEKDLVGLIAEATEAIVGAKIDPKKDAELVDRVMKGLAKK